MVNTYEIGGYRFEANSLIDATVHALHKVRELSDRQAHEEAKRLYAAVWRVQDEIQHAVSDNKPLPSRYKVTDRALLGRPALARR